MPLTGSLVTRSALKPEENRVAKADHASVLKYNPHHADDGKFTSGPGGGKKPKTGPLGGQIVSERSVPVMTQDRMAREMARLRQEAQAKGHKLRVSTRRF